MRARTAGGGQTIWSLGLSRAPGVRIWVFGPREAAGGQFAVEQQGLSYISNVAAMGRTNYWGAEVEPGIHLADRP